MELLTREQKLNIAFKIRQTGPELAVKDIDMNKRIVTGFYNSYFYFDSYGDVLVPGAAKKSIQEHGPDSTGIRKIKHAKNHDLRLLPGKILKLEEAEVDGIQGIYFETRMANTTLGNDTLIEYQEGIHDNHSIGFRYLQLTFVEKDSQDWDRYIQLLINPDEARATGWMWIVNEIELYEGSTVAIGANELTPFLGVKSQDVPGIYSKVTERLQLLEKQLRAGTQSDERMFEYEIEVRKIRQILNEIQPSLKDTVRQSQPPKRDTELNFSKLAQVFPKAINQI